MRRFFCVRKDYLLVENSAFGLNSHKKSPRSDGILSTHDICFWLRNREKK